MNKLWLIGLFAGIGAARAVAAEPASPAATKNVLFVMLDGVRWQEVFTGADDALINNDRGGVSDVPEIKRRFWRETPEERRAALFPFLWSVVAKEGQIFGNSRKGSVARVTNGKVFSYPGYSEVLCGFADDWVDSNDKRYNRNVTVLEWLHAKPEFRGKIGAYTSWDVFPFIINTPRSGIPVNAGFVPVTGVPDSPEVRLLDRLTAETPLFGEPTRFDSFTFRAGMLYLAAQRPRILFLSFDETDTQGHAGRYDRVLASAHKADGFLKELWETVQAMPEYREKTALIVTTDHGRGDAPVEWKSHNDKIPGAEFIWAAFLGPTIKPLGERHDVEPIGQNQIAATMAAILGYDYSAAVPRAGRPIPDLVAPGAAASGR